MMDNNDRYSRKNDISLRDTLGIILLFVKITVGGSLLSTGIYLTFWATTIVEQIINHPDKVPLVNALMQNQVGKEVLKISTKGDAFIIENGVAFQWVILFFIIVIIFNVIGRALAAVFQCAIKLFSNLEIPSNDKLKSQD